MLLNIGMTTIEVVKDVLKEETTDVRKDAMKEEMRDVKINERRIWSKKKKTPTPGITMVLLSREKK